MRRVIAAEESGDLSHTELGMLQSYVATEVDHPDVHLRSAVRCYSPDVRAHQLVWTDDGRRWPWDRGWAHGRRRQAVLGRRSPLAG